MPTPIGTQVTATRSAGYGAAGHGQSEQQASSRQELPEQADTLSASNTEQDTPATTGVELTKAVSRLNDYVQNLSRDLQFSIDEETGYTVITVTDSATQEVIRQIPSGEALAIAHSLEKDQGVILRAKA